MYDIDQLTDSPELRELRDALSGVAIPEPPRLDAITGRGRERRRHRRATVAGLSATGVVAVTALALGVGGAFTPAAKPGTIRTAAYTLRHNPNGTDTLTLNPGELLNPAQLQRDFARYGIPAKVTAGSYCTSDPEPAGFSQAVSGPGPGTWKAGSGQRPMMTIDPSQIPSGTELSVGYFQDTSASPPQQQANMSLINTDSYSCSSTAPDMSQPDTSNQDFGLVYGGPNPPPGS